MERKYIPLAAFFQAVTQNEITLTFDALENIMGQPLPNSAYLNNSWWVKTKPPLSHYLAWLNADFNVTEVKLGTSITFSRNNTNAYSDNVITAGDTPQTYIIRPIETSDAREFIRLQEQIFKQSEFMHSTYTDSPLTVQQVRKKLTEGKRLGNRTVFLCIGNGNFAGYAVVHGYKQSREKHIASISLAVKEEHQQMGIGQSLLKEVTDWAIERQITRLELKVLEHNEKALSLFQKNGFQEEGKRLNAVKLDDSFAHEYYMSKIL